MQYKYYKESDGTFIVTIIVKGGGLFGGGSKTHEYICDTEDEVKALMVPHGHHLGDPGLTVVPREVEGKSAAECVAENDKTHTGRKRIS